METLMGILTWVGYAFAGIGFLATVWKAIESWRSVRRFSWSEFDRLARRMVKLIRADRYHPEVIVTIGRGGAILGSVLSGNLHISTKMDRRNIPIVGYDRLYQWDAGQRSEIPNRMVELAPLKGKDVLLVAGDVLTGRTMASFLEQLQKVHPRSIKTACLAQGVTSALNADYVGKRITGSFEMPWMYRGFGYVRDSRQPVGELH